MGTAASHTHRGRKHCPLTFSGPRIAQRQGSLEGGSGFVVLRLGKTGVGSETFVDEYGEPTLLGLTFSDAERIAR